MIYKIIKYHVILVYISIYYHILNLALRRERSGWLLSRIFKVFISEGLCSSLQFFSLKNLSYLSYFSCAFYYLLLKYLKEA